MTSFFKYIFSTQPASEPQQQAGAPAEFARQVLKAIILLGESEHLGSDEDILKLFQDNQIGQQEAPEILLFLPVAFVRCWMPDYQWRDMYIETYHNGLQQERKYSETETFRIIWAVTQKYFAAAPKEHVIKKICARSTQLHAITQLLNNGERLEDIVLAPTIILR